MVARSSCPPMWKRASMCSSATTRAISSNGRVQRALLVDDRLTAVRPGGALTRAGEGGVTPAAVAPRGPEAGDLLLEHGHAQAWDPPS